MTRSGFGIFLGVLKRVWNGFTEDDGFIFAGNMAYLTLLSLFPFLIFMISLLGAFGETAYGVQAIDRFLATLPPNVSSALTPPIRQVIAGAGDGGLLTLGALVSIWSAGGIIEVVRRVIQKAYDNSIRTSMWRDRLQSSLIIVGSSVFVLLAMIIQLTLSATRKVIDALFPFATLVSAAVALVKLAVVPAILFGALYGLFFALTPRRTRARRYWPGALTTVVVWIGASVALPPVLGMIGSYNLTYGSLGGVIVTLLFFYILSIGFVLGAQVNAALVDLLPAPSPPSGH